jgi:hypothetical protein
MVDPKTKMLVYEFEPDTGKSKLENCPIRNIGSIWDMEVISNYLHDNSLQRTIDYSLDFYKDFLVQYRTQHGTMMTFDGTKLEEPPNISHNAMMILCLAEHRGVKEHLTFIERLSDTIIHQQKSDGSYHIEIGTKRDYGEEFYPGEAMLALVKAFCVTRLQKYYTSVRNAFPYYREFAEEVSQDMMVFFANWQTQALVSLYHSSDDAALRKSIKEFILHLQEKIERSSFYKNIQQHPKRCATVHVACGLEALADAYSLLTEEDLKWKSHFRNHLQIVLQFLLNVQLKEGQGDSRGVGGFGHTLDIHTQRIDVTGHVMNGLIKVETLVKKNQLQIGSSE